MPSFRDITCEENPNPESGGVMREHRQESGVRCEELGVRREASGVSGGFEFWVVSFELREGQKDG